MTADKGFCIVSGAGETGLAVVKELSDHGFGITVIDRDQDSLNQVAAMSENINTVIGNCMSDRILKEAGLDKAAALFTVLPDDRSNVFLCLSASRINPELKIYSIASDPSASKKLMLVGARRTANPNTAEGLRISSEILRPNVARFLNGLVYATDRKEGDPGYISMVIPEGSLASGRTMGDVGIHHHTGVIVVAIASTNDSMQYSPTAATRLSEGDTLIAFGTEADRNSVQSLLEEKSVSGGGSGKRRLRLFGKSR